METRWNMSGLRKTHLIFPIMLLALMLFSAPVYAAEDNQQPQEQQAQEAPQEEQPQEEAPPEEEPQQEVPPQPARTARPRSTSPQETEEPEEAQEITTEDGLYTLILSTNANMRSQPTTDSKRIMVIPFGVGIDSTQKITNAEGEAWYAISYGGMNGFIRSDVVEVEVVNIEDTEGTGEEGEETQETEGQKEHWEAEEGGAATEQPQEAEEPKSTEASISVPKPSDQNDTTKVSNSASADASVITITPDINSAVGKTNSRRVDVIFFLFLLVVLVGVLITFIVYGRFKFEYARYRNQILKDRMR